MWKADGSTGHKFPIELRPKPGREGGVAMKILHLEDNAGDTALIGRLLRQRWPDCEITDVATEVEYRRALYNPVFDVILSDHRLGSFSGAEALTIAKMKAPAVPFIFVSGALGEERAIEAVHAGASDYVLKSNLQRLVVAIESALDRGHGPDRDADPDLDRAKRAEMVGWLAAGVAHDLNNIFSPILVATALLQDRVPDEQTQRLVAMINASANRGKGLVRHMLEFMSGVSTRAAAANVRAVIAEIASVVRQTFPRMIDFATECEDNLPGVALSSDQLHQVVMNLCVNARDALEDGGRLTVRAARDSGRAVVIEVQDTGSGIPPEVLPQIWNPFFSTKPQGRGNGLGLSTVKAVAETCGGNITVQTVLGEGTTFRLWLPPAAAPEATAEPAVAAELDDERLVLIADDDDAVRLMLARVLERAGYRVVAAADGADALALFRRHFGRVVLAIVDLGMPRLDGPGLVRAMRALDPDLPILAMSGREGPGDGRGGGFEPGSVDGFIAKPYQMADLLALVADTLQRTGSARRSSAALAL